MSFCAMCGKITMDGGVLIPNGFGLVNTCVPCAVKYMEAQSLPPDEPEEWIDLSGHDSVGIRLADGEVAK